MKNLVTDLAPDAYENEQGFIPGENGDYTGSPMVYAPSQKRSVVDLAPANTDVTAAVAATSVQADSTNTSANQQAALFAPTQPVSEQKKWWEVIALLGDTAAKVYAAKKTGELLPDDVYVDSVEKKPLSWVWIAVAVVVIIILAYLTFKKSK